MDQPPSHTPRVSTPTRRAPSRLSAPTVFSTTSRSAVHCVNHASNLVLLRRHEAALQPLEPANYSGSLSCSAFVELSSQLSPAHWVACPVLHCENRLRVAGANTEPTFDWALLQSGKSNKGSEIGSLQLRPVCRRTLLVADFS